MARAANDGLGGAANPPGTLQELVQQLSRFGAMPALISIAEGLPTLTFAGLAERAGKIASELHNRGVGVGEPVGIVAPNGLDWAAACLGILASGAAAAPFDVQQSDAERTRLLAAIGCRFLFAAESCNREFGGERAGITRVEGCADLILRFPASEDPPAPPCSVLPVARPGNLALIVHTSGTTGTPKAVPLSHANIMPNISGLIASGVANPSERALLPLPLHHIYPLVVGLIMPLSAGASVVLPAGISGPELARALRIGGATVLIGVPRLYKSMVAAIMAQAKARGGLTAALFNRVLNFSIALARRGYRRLGQLAFWSLRRNLAPALYRTVSGGARIREETELTLLGLGYEVLKGYGLSETSPILAFTPPGRSPLGAAGEPLPGVELRIAKPEADGAGEVEALGPSVFSGYLNDAAATKAAFTPDGWFRTGDLGRIDADGFLYILGRSSETLVLPGGEKLDPETVEACYAGSPAIAEIGVLAEGGRLAGLAVPSPLARVGTDPNSAEAAVRAALTSVSASLPSYMQLSGFAITAEPLPRTQAGKLRRHLLPPLYREARGRTESRAAHPMAADDRALLDNPAANRVWTWLEARFPGRYLSLDMNPKLDLGINSLGWVTVTLELEQAIGVSLDEAALSQVLTLRDLVIAAKNVRRPLAEKLLLPKQGIFGRGAWYALNVLDRLLMYSVFGLQAEGTENLPKRGPYLLCPNHASNLDPAALAAALPWPVLRQVYWAGAADILFTSGWRRAFSRLMRVVAVDPGIRTAFAHSAAVLQSGHVLVWFPEAWRSKDRSLQPFLPGIGALLLKSPAPVVPVSISGTFEAWPRQRRFPRPHLVAVRFGRPLDPKRWEDLAKENGAEEQIAQSIKEAVAALGKQL